MLYRLARWARMSEKMPIAMAVYYRTATDVKFCNHGNMQAILSQYLLTITTKPAFSQTTRLTIVKSICHEERFQSLFKSGN